MRGEHGAGHGQCDHDREIEAWRARSHGAAQCRAFPHARFLPGERHPARGRSPPGRDPGRARSPDRVTAQRTSQRRASSRVALFKLIQFTAAKMHTATDLSFCRVTRNDSRLSVLSPRAKVTLLISNPLPTRVLKDCCSWAPQSDACSRQANPSAKPNDLFMGPPWIANHV